MFSVHAEHELLKSLVEGTAAASGGEFFQSLVKHLACALDVRVAFVAEFSDKPTRVRTLAFWSGDQLRDNLEYELAGTPCEEVIRGGICHHPDEVVKEFPSDALLAELNAASYLGVPLRDKNGEVLGHLAVIDNRPMPEEPRNLAVFHIFATRVRTEMLRLQAEQQLESVNQDLERQVTLRTKELRDALSEVEILKNRLQAENLYLQDEIKVAHDFEEIVGGSSALKAVLGQVEQVATTTATVLILGESGTGKELLARAIHNLSERRDRPLVKVNCAALPFDLIESELFGHEKGSFTGAFAQKLGRFELADGGTIFLDEIGELPLELQVKLLRVLQEQEFERIGGSETIRVDCRVMAATNRDLKQAAASGEFREDLFYRLNVFPVVLPPLRQRRDDIPLLVRSFTKRCSKRLGKAIDTIPLDVIDALQAYPWPGNIRELQNVIERAVILARGSVLHVDEPLEATASETAPLAHVKTTLEEVERRHITRTLEDANWKISGEGGAAEILGLNPSTLRARMRKLGIKRSD
ncbi:sigma 54-interacting transcriptional regulator [Pirellulales bacterium]|nr:sigma 54-interacting transcriptional regulator [Pirellulales bacterium]